MKFVYVILHYNAYETTCNCINSILQVADVDTEIVVVDNCSPNASGEKLLKQYDNARVHVLLHNANEGFAKGNNIGYLYAKNELGAEVIIDINNDIIISQRDIEKTIVNLVNANETVGLIAPKIVNRDGRNQNPFRYERISSLKRLKSLFNYSLYYICCCIKPLYLVAGKAYHKKLNNVTYIECNQEYMYDIVPHGSCIIFTPYYVRNNAFAFPPITFFYGEEDILYDHLVRQGLRTLYTNSIRVYHLEKVSTKTVTPEQRKMDKFQTKHRVHSLYKLLTTRLFERSR